MNIKKLEAQKEQLNKQLRAVHDKIERHKQSTIVPELQKKYKGKYFKYNNGASRDRRWPLYSFCIDIKSDWEGIFQSFELAKTNNHEAVFKTKHSSGFHLCQREITKQEYMNALKIFQKELKKLEN